jgi:putative cardiolipin synthase
VQRELARPAGEGVTDFARLNRRMHNKQMVADNRTAILGGRNIGDEYFGLHEEFNFHDLDVLGVGPVARQASAVFDRYWNSDWVRRLPATTARGRRQPSDARHAGAAARAAARPGAARHCWPASVTGRPTCWPWCVTLHPGPQHRACRPAVARRRLANHMPEAFRAVLLSAQREVLITNAYVIPDATFMHDLRDLAARGVRVRILTNSLASHDVPAVNSHYEGWRRPILRPASAARAAPRRRHQAELVDTPPVRGLRRACTSRPWWSTASAASSGR